MSDLLLPQCGRTKKGVVFCPGPQVLGTSLPRAAGVEGTGGEGSLVAWGKGKGSPQATLVSEQMLAPLSSLLQAPSEEKKSQLLLPQFTREGTLCRCYRGCQSSPGFCSADGSQRYCLL